MIRVAQVIGNIFEGGVESCILNYYKEIDRTQVCFDFFVERTSKVVDRELIESLGGKIVIVPHYTHLFKYIRFLRKAFRSDNYDIVHANMSTLNVFPLYCAWKEHVPVRISHAHNTANNNEVIRSIIKRILRPFASTFATARFACGDYSGKWLFGKKPFVVINNAIQFDRFRFDSGIRNTKRAELGYENCFVMGHIGRFVPQKNHRFLLDVFKSVHEKLPETRLLLLGEGPLLEQMKEYAVKNGISDSVFFAGTTSDTSKYYQAMDCFLLPSLYEGLPVVSIEAQVNGLKCFFADTITREAGLLNSSEFLKIDDVDCWVKAVVQYHESYGFSEDKRNQSFNDMQDSEYNIKNEADKLLTLYKELI